MKTDRQRAILEELQAIGAVWLHSGDMSRPHALLTSGRHSNGFVNTGLLTCRPDSINRILAERDGYRSGLPSGGVDWVIGSALGAVTWAFALGGVLNARAGFTEKDGEDMALKRFELTKTDRVLVCEDVISTGGSTLKTLAAVRATGAVILPQIAVLVNRSGLKELDGLPIYSLLDITIDSWEPSDCPLCKAGSEVVRPKANWAKLTGK